LRSPSVLDAGIGIFIDLKVKIIVDRLAQQRESSGERGRGGGRTGWFHYEKLIIQDVADKGTPRRTQDQ